MVIDFVEETDMILHLFRSFLTYLKLKIEKDYFSFHYEWQQ